MRSLRGCVLPALIVALLVGCGTPASGQDDESLQDAKVLFQEALKLRKEGKGADALRTFEKSIRMNRGVLSEDDQGLVQELREEYSRKLASAPEDVALLEGMAFIHAVCESDYAKAVELYSKVLAKATDPEVKTRTERLIERLRGLQEANRSTTDDIAARHREERVKAWAEMEKHDDLAAKAEAKRLEAAKAEAARLREELTQQAREEVGQAKARWQDALRQEQDQFMQSLRAEIGQQVCALSRDALARLASRDLESAMVDAFLSRLNTDRDALRQLLEKADRGALTVRSAFEMPDGARTRIEQAITGGGRLARVLFEVDTDLLCGIELRAEGNAIGWSLEKYLGEVEEDFRKTLGQASGRE